MTGPADAWWCRRRCGPTDGSSFTSRPASTPNGNVRRCTRGRVSCIPETLGAIQRFVHAHPEYEFFEIGTRRSGLDGLADATGLALPETIALMASCGYFIGIISGPLHVAAALGLRLITIINFPDPRCVVLPTLKDVGVIESEWLYPQSVVLHQEGVGGTVSAFGVDSLDAAVAGELYPYWSDAYLPLIHTAV